MCELKTGALGLPHKQDLLTFQKTNQYHGFARYTDEYNKPPPVQGSARTQSLNSASQAAVVALQMHSKPSSPQMASAPRQSNRSSSLSNYGRSNSMRTYSYTPKPSYHAGPQLPSLRSNSLRSGSMRSPPQRPQSLNVRHSAFPEEEGDDDDANSIVITTKTTKVVDSAGRTKSITTETIKTLPDGSNIIETTTKNISRPTSRSNSLRNNSLSHGGNGNYNLGKIEEDLQDFDYTYLDHENRQPPPRLNEETNEKYIQEQRKALAPAFLSPEKHEDRATSITSTQSPKRLKSILKNSAGHGFQSSPQQDGADDNVSIQDTSYKASAFSPNKPNLRTPEVPQQASITSGGTSIKFRETVETISYPAESHNLAELQHEDSLRKEQEKQKNVDLYAQAMKVAMERVYGRTSEDNSNYQTPPQSPTISETAVLPKKDVDQLAEKKLKKDHKRDKVESAGVTRNYVYENHHRDFSIRSMRGGPAAEEVHASTRKERAKEERKLAKEEEKRNAELLKIAEKERKKEEKLQKKKEKKLFFSFGRDKRKDSVGAGSIASSGIADTTAESYAQPTQQYQMEPQVAQRSDIPAVAEETHTSGGANTREQISAQNSNLVDSSAEFVDVPEFADEVDEGAKVEVIADKRPEFSSKPSAAPVLDAQSPPPRADIAEIIQGNDSVPPRADLQAYNSNVSPNQVFERKLPTLVSGENNRPEVVVDANVNDGFVDHQLTPGATPALISEESREIPVENGGSENFTVQEAAQQPESPKSPDTTYHNENLETLAEPEPQHDVVEPVTEVIDPQSVKVEEYTAPEASAAPADINYGVTADSAVSGESEQTLQSAGENVRVKEPKVDPPVSSTVVSQDLGASDTIIPTPVDKSARLQTGHPQESQVKPSLPSPVVSAEASTHLQNNGDVESISALPPVRGDLNSDDRRYSESKTTASSTKTSSRKHRFRKIIDKYFINNYSR